MSYILQGTLGVTLYRNKAEAQPPWITSREHADVFPTAISAMHGLVNVWAPDEVHFEIIRVATVLEMLAGKVETLVAERVRCADCGDWDWVPVGPGTKKLCSACLFKGYHAGEDHDDDVE